MIASSRAAPVSADLRVYRNPGTSAHVIRVRYQALLGGIRGTTTRIVDLDDGRYAERTTAGPLSSGAGFDGRRFWTTDATGMPNVEDHPDDVLRDFAWARFYGYRGTALAIPSVLRDSKNVRVLRYRYPRESGAIDVTVARSNGRPAYVVDRSEADWKFVRYANYRHVRGAIVPFREVRSTRLLTTVLDVRSVDVLGEAPRGAFSVPPVPGDSTLSGSTTLPMHLADGRPVIEARIDGGAPMRVLFDSGGSYSLTTRAAKRLGLELHGKDFTSGIGANVQAERYATVARIQIGAAVLRNQVVPVFDSPGDDTDGVIGCEVLQRFAVRFDFAGRRVTLSRNVLALHPRGLPIAMVLNGCTPEIAGDLDGDRGQFGIDTGSASGLDIMAPYVRAHDLLRKFHAKIELDGETIGGKYYAGYGIARDLDLGDWHYDDVFVELAAMNAGAFDDPTEIGNVGVEALRALTVVFDFKGRRMWLYR